MVLSFADLPISPGCSEALRGQWSYRTLSLKGQVHIYSSVLKQQSHAYMYSKRVIGRCKCPVHIGLNMIQRDEGLHIKVCLLCAMMTHFDGNNTNHFYSYHFEYLRFQRAP